MGLVNRVLPADELLPFTSNYAQRLATEDKHRPPNEQPSGSSTPICTVTSARRWPTPNGSSTR